MDPASTPVATLVADIAELRRQQPRLLIAIDGAGGSGKSTLATRLAAALGADAEVVTMDDFIVRDRMLDDSWELGWDRSRLRRQVLEPFSRGEPVVYQRFDWARNALGDAVELGRVPILIVEGITSLHPDLEPYWQARIWVETPPDVARERGRARDAGTENAQHWDRWAANDARYRAEHAPPSRADHVVAGA